MLKKSHLKQFNIRKQQNVKKKTKGYEYFRKALYIYIYIYKIVLYITIIYNTNVIFRSNQ